MTTDGDYIGSAIFPHRYLHLRNLVASKDVDTYSLGLGQAELHVYWTAQLL